MTCSAMLQSVAFSCAVRGASHIAKNQPCQDYALAFLDTDREVGVVIDSDGHGSAEAFRSATGARFACEETMEILRSLVGEDQEAEVLQRISSDERDFFAKLAGQILRRWLNRVEQDVLDRPFTAEEMAALSEKHQAYFASGTKNVKAYGCTLTAAFTTSSYWFAIGIGDSSCIVVSPDGRYLDPLPESRDNVANVTDSLCQDNAMEKFRHHFATGTVKAAFAFSDGVAESFSKPSLGLANFLRRASRPFTTGEQDADASLEAALAKLTQTGSADDVSVAAVVRTDRPLPDPVYTPAELAELLEQNKMQTEGMRASVANNAAALRQAEEGMAAKREALQGLQHEIEAAEAEVTRIRTIKRENEQTLAALRERRGALQAALDVELADEAAKASTKGEVDQSAIVSAGADSAPPASGDVTLPAEPIPAAPSADQQLAWGNEGRCLYCGGELARDMLLRKHCVACGLPQRG